VEPANIDSYAKVEESENGFTAETQKVIVKFVNLSRELMVIEKVSGRTLLHQIGITFDKKDASVRFQTAPEENWVGFGDHTRERLYHRGYIVDLWVRNVDSYIPVPFFMSTIGVGVLVNTTHHIIFDMCKSEQSILSWTDKQGVVDYYVFAGGSFKKLLDKYTDLTGKPKLPPDWSFGLWYICRTQANDYEAVNDAVNFRREEIPCDVIGLEAGWMDKNYDFSVNKTWNKERFPIPFYALNGPTNFFNALDRMGFHLELWLCNSYDLSFEAERRFGVVEQTKKETQSAGKFRKDAVIDEHLNEPQYLYKSKESSEAWFEHLKKFIDQGVDFFKQDGSSQVIDHPDRVYGNGMLDEEMHNLYPLLYSKQMYEGFEEYTGRRPVVFTVAGWVGFQAWGGTWTGDTGGGFGTLGAMLNTSLVGHSWATNDMTVIDKKAIHFGYFLPWSQINSWDYFQMPWVLGKELLEIHKAYSRLRARLIPYIYSWAFQSTRNAVPLMIPLTLEFQDDIRCREIVHEYLLGRDLLLVCFQNSAYFPEGRWKDYWTGKVIEGRQEKSIGYPSNRGGGLFVRSGGIIPHGPLMQYRRELPMDEIMLYIFPDAKTSDMDFYEDDGVSLEHKKGKYAITNISTKSEPSRIFIKVGETKGFFEGQTKNRTWSFIIAVDFIPVEVKANGSALPKNMWEYDHDRKEINISPMPGAVEIVII
ncbi:MAG: DUF5110 domain-containing protein, partial [Patescibacteria group bacterium]|nr:DUF5110 domain-containing protein [Patescibacteria group bacterium]